MATLLEKIQEAADIVLNSTEDIYVWRGLLDNGEEWKIQASYADKDEVSIRIVRRG